MCKAHRLLLVLFVLVLAADSADHYTRNVVAQPDATSSPVLVLQTGHTGIVSAMAFSPNGRWLASGSSDDAVKIWDTQTGLELRSLTGGNAVQAVAISPDGSELAAGSGNGVLTIWGVTTGRKILTVPTNVFMGIHALAFISGGKSIAAALGTDVAIVDLAGSRTSALLVGHTEMVTCLAQDPRGRWLASGGWDRLVRIWNVADWKESHILEGHTDWVASLAVSPDGSLLASASRDGTIRLWDPLTGQSRGLLKNSDGEVLAVAFDHDGVRLVSVGVGSLTVWDARKLAVVRTLKGSTAVFAAGGVISASPSGDLIAAAIEMGEIDLWNISEGKLQSAIEKRTDWIYGVAFSSDSKLLALANGTHGVRIMDTISGLQTHALPAPGWLADVLAFSPGGHLLVTNANDTIDVWDINRGQITHSLKGHAREPREIAFSPDGRWLASASRFRKHITMSELATGKRVDLMSESGAGYEAVAFSPGGEFIAAGGTDGAIHIWDQRAQRESVLPGSQTSGVYSIVFSPDGRWMVTGGFGSISVRRTENWEEARVLQESGNSDVELSLAFDPRGKLLASAEANGRNPRLWDVENGQKVCELKGHEGVANFIRFSPNGAQLVTGSHDGSARIWDAHTCALLATVVLFERTPKLPDVQEFLRKPEAFRPGQTTKDWVVVSPDGLFDGSPQAWNQILWRFNNNTFDVAPVEIFFHEFYYPGLLADILAGKHPKATTDIANIDRRHPVVLIERSDNAPANRALESRTVKLRLQVNEARPDDQHKDGCGARAVRLFRNGALVKVWHGDLQLDSQGRAQLEAELPIVAGENRFTAYAFSKSDIKSSDATLTVTGADSLKRGGVGYILAMGVNEYANQDFNLKYAVADVQEFASVFSEQQLKVQNYAALKTTYLLNSDATKANILAALERLAGASADKLTPAQQRLFAGLAPAEPEDGVFIYYAGHGYAHGQRFYLVPYDMVMAERGEDFGKPEAHAVSDLELGDVFEKIGAGRSLFVIDACRSGQALEAEEKRRGPMNSKGLAQLAYEKGMYILTASQSYQSALESAELGGGHGFLTYALVEKGLKTSEAAVDGQVELRHWLDFATQLVPQLASMQEAQKQRRRLVVVSGEEEEAASPEQQRPRVFYRREAEAQPFIVARP